MGSTGADALLPDELTTVPLRGMRAAIATSMVDSLRNTAQLTLHRQYDAGPLVAYRAHLEPNARPSLNDLIMIATARALANHPELNATIDDDERLIHRSRAVHLGMAVSVDGGLLVPVVRNADHMGPKEMAQATLHLSALARQGRLRMKDMLGGTFTVTNLGSLGVDGFTPILNRPQVGILGVGRMRGPDSTLSLTIDHRAVDGAPAARFLSSLASSLENPALLESINSMHSEASNG